jgi:membrane protein implicated in regulation of membrane protease activity
MTGWETFYLVCFALGLSFTVLSFLGMSSHLHFHVHAHSHGVHGAKGSVSVVNGFTLAAFLCWFGGCGYLLERYANFAMSLVLGFSTMTGIVGAAILFWFMARVLLPHERELTAADTEVVGVLGKVTGTIREDGAGEIQFSQNGARRFAVARSEAGVAIPRDVEVVVMRYEQGVAWVRLWDEVAGDVVMDHRTSSTE